MKLTNLATASLAALIMSSPLAALADTYKIDNEGQHAFIQFRIQHLGYSWLYGRFDNFEGTFDYDPKAPEKSSVSVNIDPSSVNSNHAERDKHLRSDEFLSVEKFPEAKFVSTGYKPDADGKGTLEGNLTLHGVTKPVTIEVEKIGEGADPWGGYRAGFLGHTTFALKDYGIDYNLGPASTHVEMILSVEGVKQ